MSLPQPQLVSNLPYLKLRGLGISVQLLIAGSLVFQFGARVLSSLAHDLSSLSNLSALMSILGNIAAIFEICFNLFVAIFFIIWMKRMLTNLPALNVEGFKSRSWQCVFGFFIPLMNLYKPMTIMQEIWKASDSARIGTVDWKNCSSSKLIYAWWIFLLISVVPVRISILLHLLGNTALDTAISTKPITLFLFATSILSAILAILMVGKLSARQDTKHERLLTLGNQ